MPTRGPEVSHTDFLEYKSSGPRVSKLILDTGTPHSPQPRCIAIGVCYSIVGCFKVSETVPIPGERFGERFGRNVRML